MMVKLSVFADEAGSSLEEQIAALRENDLKYTDVRNVDGVNVLKFSLDEARSYKKALFAEGIRVSCIGSPLGKRDVCDFGEFKTDLNKILQIADIFETDKIRLFSFYNFKGEEERVIDCLKEAVNYAKQFGVKLYHENELGIYGDSPRDCKKIVEETGCECIFDPANFVLARHDINEAEELLLPLSDFYHVKDGRYSGEIVPAGFGDGNLKKLLSKDGVTLTIEPHLFEFGGLANLVDHGLKQSEFVFDTPRKAFDAGVRAVKNILDENGIAYA